jgi:hypothetical protein
VVAIALAMALAGSARGTPPEPPAATLEVRDAPNDNGEALLVSWETPPGWASATVEIYRFPLELGQTLQTPAELDSAVARVPAVQGSYRDAPLEGDRGYAYAIRFVRGDEVGPVLWSPQPVRPKAQWFHTAKTYLLLNLLFVSGAILISLTLATRGRRFFIRKIAGLEAVEEAVGRATEMGKPVLFIPGIQDLDNVQTVAGLTILGAIARLTAKYEAGLHVPVSRSLVMSNARETIREAYTMEGRPDLYSDDMAHYLTDEQFGYVAAVDGIMVRERPAACFYMGAFFAESLILAETGNYIGAIQIAGTAMPTQLPFFVAACDYTLIGEELFAASAYLSQDPRSLGSLRGQDIGKALAMFFIAAGAILETLGRLGAGEGVLGLARFLRQFFATNF